MVFLMILVLQLSRLEIFVPTHFLEVCLVIQQLKVPDQEERDLGKSPQVALAQIDASRLEDEVWLGNLTKLTFYQKIVGLYRSVEVHLLRWTLRDPISLPDLEHN